MSGPDAQPVYLHGPAYEVGEPGDVGELPELRDDPALRAAAREAGELRRMLPNNYNTSVARLIASQVGLDEAPVHTGNIARCGHCFGADKVINLCNCAVQEPPSPGDLFLLLASGPKPWGAALLEKV